MPPRSPNAGKRTQGSRSAGKPRPSPVLLALQQHEYLSEQPHHELGAHILQSLMEMQPNCPPNFELDFRRLVPLGPEGDITQAWLNDTLLSVGVKHIRAGMPDPSAEPQGGVVPACICILDGFVATNLVDSEDSGNFNSVLRWLSAQCTLATVRRFLMPASVKLDSEGNYVLCRASGCHWVFVDVCVETDDIAVHDWVKLPHSKYTTLARPFQALVRELHKRCPQLHPGPRKANGEVSVNIHNEHQQNNSHDCGIFALYMAFAASRADYDRAHPSMDLTSDLASLYRLWLLQNLGPFWQSNPLCLEHTSDHTFRRSANIVHSNYVLVDEVLWSGNADCHLLSDAFKTQKPFKVPCTHLRLNPDELLQAALRHAQDDTTRYSSARGARLPLSLADTFLSKRADNTNRIEQGQQPEKDKVKTVPLQVLPPPLLSLACVWVPKDVVAIRCGCTWCMSMFWVAIVTRHCLWV